MRMTTTASCTHVANFWLLFSGALVLALPATASHEAQTDTLWSEDWEGDFTDNWFVDAGTWEVGEPTSGPGSAYDGQNVSGTVLDGNYAQPVDSRLIRFSAFTIPPASDNPRLRFWHWFSFEQGDRGEIQVSADGGLNWETVSPAYIWTGSNAWTHPLIDLSDYQGMTIQVAFYFHSECTRSFCPDVSTGWYVDDVVVVTGPVVFSNPEDFESDIGDWSSEAGSWQVGRPTSGPDECHSTLNCAATRLDGNYAQPVDSRLVSPPFLVPGSGANPALQFWHWFSFEQGDRGTIQVRPVGGDWESLDAMFVNTSSNAWTFYSASMSGYAGQNVQVAFHFHSECTRSFCPDVSTGWYVDDVRVEGVAGTTMSQSPSGVLAVRTVSPNPSVAAVTIAIDLSQSADVTLRVFDMLGREVAPHAMQALAAGEHRIPWEAAGLTAGVYLYRVEARVAGRTESRSGTFTLLE